MEEWIITVRPTRQHQNLRVHSDTYQAENVGLCRIAAYGNWCQENGIQPQGAPDNDNRCRIIAELNN